MITYLEYIIKRYSIFVILILAVPAVAHLFPPGFYGASDDVHIAWLYEMDKVVRQGQIPPRFVPDLSYGFGYPLFNYVFPLPFYIAEVFHLLGFNLINSIKLLFFFSVPLSGYFMYLLLRKLTIPILAMAGAVVYMYTPYRATDIYIRGAIGEILLFAFLPLPIMALINLFSESEKNTSFWVSILGISIGLMALTHNIGAYMFIPFLLLLAVLLAVTQKLIGRLVRVIGGFLLGALISSYFWLPALLESQLVKYSTVFNFSDHFPTLSQLFKPYWGFGASVPGPYDGMSFFLGWGSIVLLGIGVISLLTRKVKGAHNVVLVWAMISFLGAIFLMNYRSTIVWDNIPLLPYFQFPWRFLMLTTLVSPIFIIGLPFISNRKGQGFGALLIVFTIIISTHYFAPQDHFNVGDEYYLQKYIPTLGEGITPEYAKNTEEYLRLPVATLTRPSRLFPSIEAAQPISDITVLSQNSMFLKAMVNASQSAAVNFNKYYFPGWEVLVDNDRVDIKPGEPFGQISFTVPPGKHIIQVGFKEVTYKLLLDIMSLLVFIICCIIVGRGVFRKVRYAK